MSPVAAAIVAALFACTPASTPSSTGFERVILIVVDTLRRDHVWPYDPNARTPNLRRLAERGQVFTNGVASFHQTTMSMASLFTGKPPSIETPTPAEPLPWNGFTWCGMSRLAVADDDSCIPQHLDTLAEDLQAAGYWTIGVASNVFLYNPAGYDQGFDDWVQLGKGRGDKVKLQQRRRQLKRQRGELVTLEAIEALERRPHSRFFLYVHYMDVHDWLGLGRKDYQAGVIAMDDAVGVLLDHLEAEGLLEDSLVVFTADHGEVLPSDVTLGARGSHQGNPSFEPVLRIPLIVAPPTAEDPAVLLRSQDMRGLLLRWLNRPAPQDPPEFAASELLLTEREWQTYRRWPFKSAWERKGDGVRLFDLRSDPPELHDVSKDHPEIMRSHRERIEALSAKLATNRGIDTRLSEEDSRRLRALGYAN